MVNMRLNIGQVLLMQFIAISVYLINYKLRKNKNTKKQNEWLHCLFYMYIAGLITITFLPLFISASPLNITELKHQINIVPFKNIIQSVESITESNTRYPVFYTKLLMKNVLGNILILVPFGLFIAFFRKKKERIGKVILKGFTISFVIESTQLLMTLVGINRRSFDVDDLIMNTLGYLIGYYIMKMIEKKLFINKPPARS